MSLTRRDFLKLAGLGAGAMALRPFGGRLPAPPAQIPQAEHLGRLTATLDLRSAPRVDYPPIKKVYDDTVIEWLREVNAQTRDINVVNQRWVETPEGYLYASHVQPVRNQPNEPLKAMPDGKSGFWAEVTVPYVDLVMDNPPARSPWAKDIIGLGKNPRLYYSQVIWVNQVQANNGQVLYHFDENSGRAAGATGGGFGDIFWADGRAFRPLTADDVSPINPDVDPNTKKVVVNLTYQTLSCFEENREVYFCRCSTGGKFDAFGNAVDTWATGLGEYLTSWKTISIHMTGGASGAGYDTPAVSWANFFDSEHGIAVHSAFWHNDFGQAVSHGCVNVRPEDAKWIFRWTAPGMSLDAADVRVPMPGGTHVIVQERSF